MISIWSFSFIVVDVLIEFIPSLSIAFYRFTIASIAYLLIDLYQTLNKRKIDENNNLNLNKAYSKRDWIYIFISSLFGVSLFFFTQYSSINLIGPSIPALFVCLLAPVIIATLAII
ncbi:MAG: EamA family transporter, partial [Promethearchaeota archaeon]